MRLVKIYLPCLIFVFFGCTVGSDSKHWSHMTEFVGTYQLLVSRSEFNELDTNFAQYNNFTLELRHDTTFYFSSNVPIFVSQEGRWRLSGDDISTWCILQHQGGIEDQIMPETEGAFSIKYPRSKKDSNQARFLYFVKRK